ncbi:MAG: hypothetical protein IIB15_08380, partial [Chloroflexi bacterium]|nr:hypothetical protein [Chloroflexota bacterium]
FDIVNGSICHVIIGADITGSLLYQGNDLQLVPDTTEALHLPHGNRGRFNLRQRLQVPEITNIQGRIGKEVEFDFQAVLVSLVGTSWEGGPTSTVKLAIPRIYKVIIPDEVIG